MVTIELAYLCHASAPNVRFNSVRMAFLFLITCINAFTF